MFFRFGCQASVVITSACKQEEELLHVVFCAREHLTHETIAGSGDEQSGALFGLVAAFLLGHAPGSLFQVKRYLARFQAFAQSQVLLLQLAQLLSHGADLLFQASTILW